MFGESKRSDISAGLDQSVLMAETDLDTVAVLACRTEAAADVVRQFLKVNGVDCITPFIFSVYPQLAWVEGYHVQVSKADEARARELLSAMDRNDVAPLD